MGRIPCTVADKAVDGVAAVLAVADDESVQQVTLHKLALMGDQGACEVAAATAGRDKRPQALLAVVAGDHTVAAARRLPVAQQRAEAELQRYWRVHDKPGTGICFEADPSEAKSK